MERLFAYIRQIVPLDQRDEEVLAKILVQKTYNSGTVLCNMGDTPTKVYFIKSGFARGYAWSKKGTTYNRALYTENEFMASLSALILNKKAELALECLTDCDIIETDYHEFMALGKKYPSLSVVYNRVLEENFIKLEQNNIQLATMTATERYLALRERIPRVDNYISQYHIASHLGITPIQLSRIRKTLWASK